MIRNCGLEDISDGRIYGENDMVRADTNSCSGCKSVCCHGMGSTIILDPYDVYRLTSGLECTFEKLMDDGKIELNIVDGIIMPNLKMNEKTKSCSFLNDESRCDIHGMRPGICRLFPLGRYWEDETHFKYILQTGQCHKDNLTKIKVKKWIDNDNFEGYKEFIVDWHIFLKKVQANLKDISADQIKILNMFMIRTFYSAAYDGKRGFKEQFDERLKKAQVALAIS